MSFSSCLVSSGIALDCRANVGGIDYIYVANANAGPVTYDLVSGSTCEIDTIYVNAVALTSGDFYKFEVPKQSSGYTETVNVSQENGTVWYQQDVALVFNKLQCSTRNELLVLAQNTKLLVIVKDNNGRFWTCGLVKGAEMTAGSNGTGVAYGDRNGYTLTITGYESNPMFEVDPTVVGE